MKREVLAQVPFNPCLRHGADFSQCFRRSGVFHGGRFQGPEALDRHLFGLFANHRGQTRYGGNKKVATTG